ncbi:MAG: T9SS type A sorting domain-containing protein [Taibaiella sp.]|jgi:hypothetical protein
MKRFLLIAATLCSSQLLTAQTKPFDLYVVAEGNFGSPNGDVFKVARTDSATITASTGLYQTANTSSGIDVLQDFGIFGDKAVFCGKGGSSNPIRIAITSFPSFDTLKTFTGGGVQCLGKASNTKGYMSMATGNTIQQIDLINNTLIPVTDPGAHISSYASYMTQANGFMYVTMGAKIVKIDTLTNATTGSILPGIGSIAGMEYDATNNCIWLLGKVSGISVLVKMEPSNNDLQQAPIILTGITNAAYLRLARNKLYFLSNKNVHAYNIAVPNIPTTTLYTSTLPGSAYSFAYGKSFYADPVTGDFAMATAGNFAEPSRYEIVDGSTFQMIDSGHVTGRIANELILHTYNKPIPDSITLSDVYAPCSVTLSAPTATVDSITITATTNDSLSYSTQGNFTVTWIYTNGYSIITQTQHVTIEDTIAPVPDVAVLPNLQVNCPYTLAPPMASDNCSGVVTATTDSLNFTTGGNYNINWTYADAYGNITTQVQHLVVNCPTGIDEMNASAMLLYPNPALDVVYISFGKELPAHGYSIALYNVLGKRVLHQFISGTKQNISLAGLSPGIYSVSILKNGTKTGMVQKLIVQ